MNIPSGAETVTIDGNGGMDTTTIDYSGGALLFNIVVNDTGDTHPTSLGVKGNGTTTTAVYTPSGTTPGSGTFTVGGSQATQTITFMGLTPTDMFNMATATVTLPNANDNVAIANGFDFTQGGTHPALVVSGTSGGTAIEEVAAWNNGTLLIDGATNGGTTNTFTVNSANNAHNNTNITINTGNVAGNTDLIDIAGPLTLAGNLTLQSGQNITIGGAISSTGAGTTISMTANTGSITESAGGTITGATLSTSSATGTTLGTIATPLQNAVASFSATNSTSGNISLTNIATAAAPSLTVTNVSDTVGSVTVSESNPNNVANGGNITVDVINAGTGAVTIQAVNGSLLDGEPANTVNITGGAIGLSATGASGINLDVNTTLTATAGVTATTSNNAPITLVSPVAGIFQVDSINAGSGAVSLTAGTSTLTGILTTLHPNGGVAEVTGGTVTLTALGPTNGNTGQIGFFSGGAQFFEVSATTLNASTDNSRLWISAIGGTAVGTVNAGTNTAFLKTVNGNLTSTHVGTTPDITAATVVLLSPGTSGSFGTAASPLLLQASTLQATVTVRRFDRVDQRHQCSRGRQPECGNGHDRERCHQPDRQRRQPDDNGHDGE